MGLAGGVYRRVCVRDELCIVPIARGILRGGSAIGQIILHREGHRDSRLERLAPARRTTFSVMG